MSKLLLWKLMERGARMSPDREVVTRKGAGDDMHRTTLGQIRSHAGQFVNALRADGVRVGDRVATFMWNNWQHLVAYYALPAMGAVLHTVNLRLPSHDVQFVIQHANSEVLLVDQSLLGLLEPIAAELGKVIRRTIVVAEPALGPWKTSLPNTVEFSEYLAGHSEVAQWQDDGLEETDAVALCYTSGTTGHPKGVAYSHRSTYLHTMATGLTDALNLSMNDSVLLIVPMFHALSWCIPFTALMAGSRIVLPHRFMDPRNLVELMALERVTLSCGVPTIWVGIRAVLEAVPSGTFDLHHLTRATCGGAAPPVALIQWYTQTLGVEFIHGWGMTETNPVVTLSHGVNRAEDMGASAEQRVANIAKQGMLLPGLELRVEADNGSLLPWDGTSVGEILVRGPWVCTEYYKVDAPEKFRDGWLRTGDMGVMDRYGCLTLRDRSKDMIKSGGEWISSVDLENHIMALPEILHAAVVAVPHPKWDERPVVVAALKKDAALSLERVRDHCSSEFAKWQLPDDLIVWDAIPLTSTGKFDKKTIRAKLADLGYSLPSL